MTPMRIRALFVLLACTLFVEWPATPALAASPISPNNRPTAVPNRTNGEMPDSDLVNVAPGCRAYRAAGSSLGLLVAQAREEGVDLRTTECYRPLDEQVEVRQQATANGNASCASSVGGTSSQPQGHSMHGWGKATDLNDAGQTGLAFGSPGYQFMKRRAAAAGWNHPGWAEPHGSSCPEPWHWEWVGDGGTAGADPIRADVVSLIKAKDDGGYAIVTGLGAVSVHGSAVDHGSAATTPINWLVAGSAPTATGLGYWLVALDGGIFNYGDAAMFGSMGGTPLNQPIVAMAATPSGHGYWMVAADGGIFNFGDADFFGSLGNLHLNRPIVGMAATADGLGYWLVASDGGIFAFGDARFLGSMGSTPLTRPVVAMAPTANGQGYWLVASDGGMFNFGTAKFFGSMGGTTINAPVVGLSATKTANGYWMVAADGGIFNFGDATFFGAG